MAGLTLIAGLLWPVNTPLSAADNGFDKVILSQEYTFGLCAKGGIRRSRFRTGADR